MAPQFLSSDGTEMSRLLLYSEFVKDQNVYSVNLNTKNLQIKILEKSAKVDSMAFVDSMTPKRNRGVLRLPSLLSHLSLQQLPLVISIYKNHLFHGNFLFTQFQSGAPMSAPATNTTTL